LFLALYPWKLPIFRPKRFRHGFPQWRELVLHGVPDNLVVDAVVCVPQKISHAAKALPIRDPERLLRHRRPGELPPPSKFAADVRPQTWSSDRLYRFRRSRLREMTRYDRLPQGCPAGGWHYP
jgi:hypothetical protein